MAAVRLLALAAPALAAPERAGFTGDLVGGARHALTLSLEIIPAIYNHFQAGAALIVA